MHRTLPYGDRAVLVELDDTDAAMAAAARLRGAGLAGLVDLVPGARTVLVVLDPSRTTVRAVRHAIDDALVDLTSAATDEAGPADTTTVVLDVVYDGEDLTWLAEHAGCPPEEVVRRHAAATYRVAFCGFAPGFAYCTGLDPSLHVPRLATPRPRVPAGSVAVAAGWCGVYPREMPGGWRLLGRTDAPLWDLARAEPALLVPGTVVRFRATS